MFQSKQRVDVEFSHKQFQAKGEIGNDTFDFEV